jgi:hypothetical protein
MTTVRRTELRSDWWQNLTVRIKDVANNIARKLAIIEIKIIFASIVIQYYYHIILLKGDLDPNLLISKIFQS